MVSSSQWLISCVIFGAGLFKSLSEGRITKDDAIIKIKGLSSQLTDNEARYLLMRINNIVYGYEKVDG